MPRNNPKENRVDRILNKLDSAAARLFRMLALATLAVLLSVGVVGHRSLAQAPAATVESAKHGWQIAEIQRRLEKLDEEKLSMRLERLEEKIDWLQWAVRGIAAAVAAVLAERVITSMVALRRK